MPKAIVSLVVRSIQRLIERRPYESGPRTAQEGYKQAQARVPLPIFHQPTSYYRRARN